MNPIEFVKKAILQVQAENAAKGKAQYKGAHVVYTGLNDALIAMYAPETLDRTNKDARKEWVIGFMANVVMKSGAFEQGFAHGGPMIYLKGDAPARRERIQSKEQALNRFGITPPPVIAPKAKKTK